jgi:hypothetical protein
VVGFSGDDVFLLNRYNSRYRYYEIEAEGCTEEGPDGYHGEEGEFGHN